MKGQASIEFLLVIVIALLFILAVIEPAATRATSSINDVSNLAKITTSVDKLANSVQYAANSAAGTKQTVKIIIPPGAAILCEGISPPYGVKGQYTLTSAGTAPVTACETDGDGDAAKCTKKVLTYTRFSCVPLDQLANAGDAAQVFRATVTQTGSGPELSFIGPV